MPDSPTLQPVARWPRLRRWVKLLLGIYITFVVLLGLFQRSLIYHPFRQAALHAVDSGLPKHRVSDVVIPAGDDVTLRGWLIRPSRPIAASSESPPSSDKTLDWHVLYFGGNAANRSFRLNEVGVLSKAGAQVLIVDYRGFGDCDGSPSEECFARDAHQVWGHATETLKFPPDRIVIYGESLGGGVAVRLAQELCLAGKPPGGLILRSTFSSLVDAGRNHFPWVPVSWLLQDRFESERRIRDVTCPLLQLHGERDTVVPFRLGRKLFDAAPETSNREVAKRFVTLPKADHNDVLETSYREVDAAISEFFRDLSARQ